MSLIFSFLGFVVACLFAYISSQLKDDMESQVTKMSAILAFILSFLFSPLLFKLVMVGLLLFVWSYLGDRLSLLFYRRLNK